MPRGIPNKPTTTTQDADTLAILSEPAQPITKAEAALDAIVEDATPADLVKHLIERLGHATDKVSSLEIRSSGIIRVIGTDRSLRTHRFEWPKADDE